MISSSTVYISLLLVLILSYLYRIYYPYPPPITAGIDIGTTFSSIAVFNDGFGNVTLLKDDKNRSLIPSIVTFFENGSILVGEYPSTTETQHHVTIFDSKRFIGRQNINYSRINKYPFQVKEINGSTYFVLPSHYKSKYPNNLISPSDIASLIVEKLQTIFLSKFKYKPKGAVIGVPVEFDSHQRNCTKNAVETIGIKVLRLVNEPIAAAMACDVHRRNDIEFVVVFDLGGGTLDVSVLSANQNSLSTIAISGDENLGGRDFTNCLSQCVAKDLNIHNMFSFTSSEFASFLRAIEEAKIALSVHKSTSVSFLMSSVTHSINVTTESFQQCCDHLFKRLLIPINLALQESEIKAEQVQEVVLVGGSTRMPYLRKLITELFGHAPNLDIDPDSAVVIGLANQAGIMTQGWPLDKLAIDIPNERLNKLTPNY